MKRLLTGAEILIDCLEKEEVEYIFGHPGGVILDIYEKLHSHPSIQHILVRHEQAGTHMAEGYAKASGKVGVVLVTSGPGITNTVTGIADAFKDNIPLVVIAGQVPTHLIGKDAFQEIDAMDITKSITKNQWSVREVSNIPRIVHQAFFTASAGRPGPVLIEVPKNILTAKYEYDSEQDYYPKNIPVQESNSSLLQQVAQVICNARKPVLCVGGGVINSNADSELRNFAIKYNIPVAMTLHGLGAFPSNNPLSLGMLGVYGNYHANKAVSACDVLITIGARLDNRVTSVANTFSPSSFKIQLDIDNTIINKNIPADLAIVGDAKRSLVLLQEVMVGKPHTQSWLDQINKWKEECPLTYEKDDLKLHAGQIIEKISNLTQGNAVLVTDVGQHQMVAAQFYQFVNARSHITSGSLGTMGFAVPASIGASFVIKDRPVVCISGDGGFQMNLQELVTARIHKLPIKFVVMNNNSLGMIRQLQDLFHREVYTASDLENPDFAQLFKGFDCPVFSASTPQEADEALTNAFKINDLPVGIIFNLAKEEMIFPMVASTKPISEMIVGTTPHNLSKEIQNEIVLSLLEHGLIKSPDEICSIDHIKEGFINYVFSVKTNNHHFIIKHAGDKARGKPSVKINPIRLQNEFDAINLYKRLCKEDHFPKTHYYDHKRHLMVMDKIPQSYNLLDSDLQKGVINVSLAKTLGAGLADMHNETHKRGSKDFNNIEMIKQIKIPFIYDGISSDPREIEEINKLKNSLLEISVCLVHGDFKPNNIFVLDDNFILIDFEQAYYGNPLLDFSYLPASYIVLSFLHLEKQKIYLDAVKEYWESYKETLLFNCNELAALRHLGVILLARVDGIIKYDFLQQNTIASILRLTARDFILGHITSLSEGLTAITQRVAELTSQLKK